MTEKIVKIGLAGFGTVGSGVAKIILQQADSIAAKTGLRLQLSCIVDKDVDSPRPVKLPDGVLTDDMNRLLNDESIEIAVELVGGTKAAKDIQMKMLRAGKHVVTANKALLAEYGDELYKTADKYNRRIALEASCCGGIPIVSGIRIGLAANNINAIYGILNGTCNYILTSMTDKNKEFGDALNEAQKLGYAEADPTLDINGGDSAHKLVILSSIAFDCEIKLRDVSTEGIEKISKDDIRYGGEMGYRLKLLAIGEKTRENKISLRVHPSFIPKDNPLARVDGSFNAISLFGDAVGNVIYYGRGAGMMPTASAIVADIIDISLAKSNSITGKPHLKSRTETKLLIEKAGNSASRFYVRLMVKDQPGVFAQIGRILAKHAISISGILQHEGRGPENTIPVVITTHTARQSKVTTALQELENLKTVCSVPVCIRIVDIPEDKDK